MCRHRLAGCGGLRQALRLRRAAPHHLVGYRCLETGSRARRRPGTSAELSACGPAAAARRPSRLAPPTSGATGIVPEMPPAQASTAFLTMDAKLPGLARDPAGDPTRDCGISWRGQSAGPRLKQVPYVRAAVGIVEESARGILPVRPMTSYVLPPRIIT